jgi:hypothetical protein
MGQWVCKQEYGVFTKVMSKVSFDFDRQRWDSLIKSAGESHGKGERLIQAKLLVSDEAII